MLALIALTAVVLVALVVFVVRKEAGSATRKAESQGPASAPPEDPVEDVAKPTGPPPSGAADPLENMRAALNGMELGDLENMLEMGGTLKPGVEELILAEVRRRGRES